MPDLRDELERHLALAWAGGVLDVYGYFSLEVRSDSPTRQPRITFAPRSRVDPGVMLRLQDIFGGAIATVARRRKGSGLPGWRLSGARKCQPAIAAVLPYLAVKRAPASVVLAYCRQITEYKSDAFPRAIDEDELRRRRVIELEWRSTIKRLQSRVNW